MEDFSVPCRTPAGTSCQALTRQVYSLKLLGLIVMLMYAKLQDQQGAAVEVEIKAGSGHRG
jgi:hypothetical protein